MDARPTRVEIYNDDKPGPRTLVEALDAYTVPRPGEWISVGKKSYLVKYVTWAVDTDINPQRPRMRANVVVQAQEKNDG